MNILDEFENYLTENYNFEGEKNTIKGYYSDIKQFLNFFKEYYNEDIIDFKRVHVSEYKQYFLIKNNFAFSTINRKLSSLSIYEDFLLEKKIRKNEIKVIKKFDFYKIDRPYITSNMLPKKTIKKIKLKAGEVSKRDYAIIVILDEGGLRVSELVNLQLKRDIDFDMYNIRVLGKGNKVRAVFMNEVIISAIKDYLEEREKMLNGRKNKYLFVSNKTANTNKPMSRVTINKILEKYCLQINEKKINPHIMRHDAATRKYEEGYSDLMLKKFLGHSSNATDIYTHPGGERYRENMPKNG